VTLVSARYGNVRDLDRLANLRCPAPHAFPLAERHSPERPDQRRVDAVRGPHVKHPRGVVILGDRAAVRARELSGL
jgi:hypothetical protein